MRQANGQDVARRILKIYALRAYQKGEIGGGHLWRLLGFETRDGADQFLADHNPGHNYTLADLEETVKPLDNLASNAGHLQYLPYPPPCPLGLYPSLLW